MIGTIAGTSVSQRSSRTDLAASNTIEIYAQRNGVSFLLVMLLPGTPAPDFTVLDHHGDEVELLALRGTWVVLWWYAKAATEG